MAEKEDLQIERKMSTAVSQYQQAQRRNMMTIGCQDDYQVGDRINLKTSN